MKKIMKKTLGIVSLVFLMSVLGVFSKQEVYAASFGSATSIVVNKDYSDYLSSYSEEDYYCFNLTTSGVVAVTLKTPQQGDTYPHWSVTLYNSNYEFMNSMDIYGNETNTVMTKMGLPSGTYYIKVESYGSSNYSDDTYTLNVNYSVSNYWEKEFNGDFSTSDIISINQSYYGTLKSYSDEDYYRFSVTSSGVAAVTLTTPQQGDAYPHWSVTLYNSNYESMNSMDIYGNETNTVMTKMGLPAGTYYIKVESYGSSNYSDDTYTLNVNYSASNYWEKEFNGSFNLANNIKMGKTYSGTLKSSSDEDYYKISNTSKGECVFRFTTPKQASSSTYWYVTLYNSKYNEVESIYVYGDKKNHYIDRNLSKGIYYIKVESYSSSNYSDDTYKLSVKKVSAPALPASFKVKSSTYNSITLNWSKVDGATGYYIYRSTNNGKTWKYITTIKSNKTTSFKNKGLKTGTTYRYAIVTYIDYGKFTTDSGDVKYVKKKCTLSKPVLQSLTKQKKNSVTIQWKSTGGATGYDIYVYNNSTKKYSKLKTIEKNKIWQKSGVAKYTLKSKKLKAGKTYKLKIKAYRKVGKKKVYSKTSNVKSVKM